MEWSGRNGREWERMGGNEMEWEAKFTDKKYIPLEGS